MAAIEALVTHLNRRIAITLATNSFCSLNAELLEPRHQLRPAVFVRVCAHHAHMARGAFFALACQISGSRQPAAWLA